MYGFTYQQERQLDIMETAAGNEGSAGGMMGAGMGMGMGMGVGTMFGQQMQQVSQSMNSTQAPPPPPPTFTPYYLYVNNAQQGPFDLPTLQTLAQSGTLTPQTLVWKQGMANWAAASSQPDLMGLFGSVPPPPPPPVMP